MATTQYVCTNCYNLSFGKYKHRGNVLIEIILWFCAIVPGLIYTIWRASSKHVVCPQCGNATLIPTNTPKGKQLLSEVEKNHPEAITQLADEQVSRAKKNKNALIAACVIVGLYVLYAILR